MVIIDQEEAAYAIREMRWTKARVTGPDPPTMEAAFMLLLATDGNVIQRGACVGAETVAELEADDSYLRGMEQLQFLNGDIHFLARRLVRGLPPQWLSHKACQYLNGIG